MTPFLFLACGSLLFAFVEARCTKDVHATKGKPWDTLRAKWGPDPRNADYFRFVPRTAQEASTQGFEEVSGCEADLPWVGRRFVRNGDYTMTPLYDVNGFVAGIQTSIPNNLKDGYPSNKIRFFFTDDDGDRLTSTAYFVDPQQICTKGRNRAAFDAQGTGTGLYIQIGRRCGTRKIPVLEIPLFEENLVWTDWVKGLCVPTMGLHYMYGISTDMDCDEVFPVFPLYDHGHLNGFGWSIMTNMTTSDWFEHPRVEDFQKIMPVTPICFYENGYGYGTFLHIYFTEDFGAYACV